MSLNSGLLEIIVCPACRAKLELRADGNGLRCVACRRVYPIRDGIPVLIVEEAQVEPLAGAVPSDQA